MKRIQNFEGEYLVYDEKLISEADAKKETSTSIRGQFSLPYGFLIDETLQINDEVIKCPEPKNRHSEYQNDLKDTVSLDADVAAKQAADSGNKYFYNKFTMDDNEVSEAFKGLGGKITRDVVYCNVQYNPATNKIDLLDDNGNPADKREGYKTNGEAKITEVTHVFKFNNNDFALIENAVKNNSSSGLSGKALALYDFYQQNMGDPERHQREKLATMKHEIKHIQNEDTINIWRANPKSGQLSAENQYRLMEDDEKTATLQATFFNIEQYFKNGEKPEILNAHPSYWLVNEIAGKSKDEVKALLTDYQKVVEGSIKDWENGVGKSYRDTAKGQFAENMGYWAKQTAVHKVGGGSDVNDPEYLQQRKFMYQFKIYNPDTGKKEPVQLSQFAQHAEITPEIQNNVINPNKQEINRRKNKLSPELEAMAVDINQENWNRSNRADDMQKLQDLLKKHNLSGQQAADIEKDFWAAKNKDDFIRDFDINNYQNANGNSNDPNQPVPPSQDNDVLEIGQLDEKTDGNLSWKEWADKNGYAYSDEKEGQKLPGYHKVSKGNKESEILYEGAGVKIKSKDFSVYRQLVAKAEADKYDNIDIGPNMSDEQKTLLALACLERGMSFTNGPEHIDPNMASLQNIPDELRDKIQGYNEKMSQGNSNDKQTKDRVENSQNANGEEMQKEEKQEEKGNEKPEEKQAEQEPKKSVKEIYGDFKKEAEEAKKSGKPIAFKDQGNTLKNALYFAACKESFVEFEKGTIPQKYFLGKDKEASKAKLKSMGIPDSAIQRIEMHDTLISKKKEMQQTAIKDNDGKVIRREGMNKEQKKVFQQKLTERITNSK